MDRSFFGPPCIVVHAAVRIYQRRKKAVRIYAVFQLDKLSVILAEKQNCAIRLRGVIISGVTHSYIGMSASHEQLQNTRSCASAEGPRDALCQSVSCQLLHNCNNKLYNKSTTNRSDGVIALRSTDVQ